MMTQVADPPPDTGRHRCGCCGRERPAGRLAELGSTPGIFICAPCALWAARRAGPLSALSQVPIASRRLWSRLRRLRTTGHAAVSGTIPILSSTDLDRTATFFSAVGFGEEGRSEQYLVLDCNDTELHFARHDTAAAGQCLVIVADALALWKRLSERGISGLEDVADREYGLRDFTLVDPDGNRVRIGSSIPCD